MADVRPFRALRYDPALDLAPVVCPPFDTISPQLQRELHERSPLNAVRIELALDDPPGRYANAAKTLAAWSADGTLRRDDLPAFYLLRQSFVHGDGSYMRTLLLARLRAVPWTEGSVLPHEQTFPKHKADRLQLMKAARINSSPVFLFYRDNAHRIHDLLARATQRQAPLADFDAADGQHHQLIRIDEPAIVDELHRAFADEVVYIADGHHRYETANLYRDEVKAERSVWTGEEPENFAMVALVAAADPGLLVLPTHRVTAAQTPWADVRARLEPLFTIEPFGGEATALATVLASAGRSAWGFATAEAGTFVVTPKDAGAIDALLPQDRSPAWRALEYAVGDFAIMRHAVGLSEDEMKDGSLVWFTEDAAKALADVTDGRANYSVILNSVPVEHVLELADAGERMPQKSTFFYPKAPTGLVFNPLSD